MWYAFLGEADHFRFQGLPDLGDDLNVNYFYERIKASVPIVLDWAIGSLTCTQALKIENYACSENSYCIDSDAGLGGYRCSCNTGYHGNPYLNQGCQGIYRNKFDTFKPLCCIFDQLMCFDITVFYLFGLKV